MASPGGFPAPLAVAFAWWFSIISTHPAWRVPSRRLRPRWGGSVLAQPSGDWEDQGLPGPPPAPVGSSHASRAQQPRGTWLPGGRPVLTTGCHLLPHAASLLALLLLAVWILAANNFARGPLRRPASALMVGGWRWGERGRLPERPTISVWLTLGRWHCGPRGPGGHTSSVYWSPPTCLGSAKRNCYHCRSLAFHASRSGRRRRVLGPPVSPSSSGEAERSPTLSLVLLRVPP